MEHQKCEKHKGTVNLITIEFPASNCPWCSKEKAEEERNKLQKIIDDIATAYPQLETAIYEALKATK